MDNVELLVVGAGPAGLGAAIEARRRGVDVLLVDDKDKPGGQLFKQIHKFFGSQKHRAGTRGFDIGEDLLAGARELGVSICLNSKVLGIMEDGTVSLQMNEGPVKTLRSRCIVLATGASEKAISFPGWTLPGVITAGAAQTMSNIERVLPGERILMVGSGNVGLIVSYQLLQAGAEIAAVVEAGPEITGYAVHAGKVRRAGVPIYTGHTVVEARGDQRVEEVDLAAVDENWDRIRGSERTVAVDTVCLAVGLRPNSHLARMAGCELKYYPELGGFLPLHNERMETSRTGIYVAGDLAGIEEANTALDEGRLAGISAAAKLDYIGEEDYQNLFTEIKKRLYNLRQGPFGIDRARAKKRIILASRGQERENEENGMAESRGENAEYDQMVERTDVNNIKELPGYPESARTEEGAVACLECGQRIPCDPCVDACPFGAISIEGDITSLPALDGEKCRGCGLCIAACPGQAIFLIDKTYGVNKAAVSFPYEYLPYPEEGAVVTAVDRSGNPVTEAEIVRVEKNEDFDRTAVVTITIPPEYIDRVRFIERE